MIGKYKIEKLGEGKGTFGNIHLVTDTQIEDGEVLALKKIDLGKCEEKDKQHCHDEVKHLKKLKHKHVVRYIDSFQQERYLCIVMEYCRGGNLRQFINKYEEEMGEGTFLTLFTQICDGLKYLHSENIAHRDIKTTNILLTEEDVIKIADLGLARIMENVTQLTKVVGSPYFMSPEMLAGKAYTIKNIPCLAKDLPYGDQIKKLFCDMLQKDSDSRPSASEILGFLSQSYNVTKQKKKTDFSKTCPARLRWNMDDSGVGFSEPEGEVLENPNRFRSQTSHIYTATIEVNVTEQQKEYLDQVKRLESYIMKAIGRGEDTGILREIRQKISETKDMDRDTKFLDNMKTLLGQDMFQICKVHLQSLWIFKRELLKVKFQIS